MAIAPDQGKATFERFGMAKALAGAVKLIEPAGKVVEAAAGGGIQSGGEKRQPIPVAPDVAGG